MKKRIALVASCVILVSMLLTTVTGCVGLFEEIDEDYTGSILNLYFSDLPTTFDPMYAYNDNAACSILSLMYEGLYKYNKDGEVVKALAESYRWVSQNDVDGYSIEITIRDSAWSDGTAVSAYDFVYAWRRILHPGNSSSAAAMLYQIKNARAVKSGDDENITKYDLGASATEKNVLRIDFEGKPDLDLFFTYLASPALVPMRDDVVDKIDDWDSTSAILLSNGPFYLKSFDASTLLRLERNRYYKRDVDKDEMNEYVTPYRLVVNLGTRYEYTQVDDDGNESTASIRANSTGELASKLWENNNIKYYGNIWIDQRTELADSVTSADTQTTEMIYFNTTSTLFQKAEVRRALSLAIDREALIASTVVYADAAKGIITDDIFNGDGSSNTFRSKAQDGLISYNLAEAKELLKTANVTGGSFDITVRASDEVACAVAEYLSDAWEELGFRVGVNEIEYLAYGDTELGYDNLIADPFNDLFYAGGEDIEVKTIQNGEIVITKYEGFDVILIDLTQLANDPFATLAPFAMTYSGGGVDLSIQQETGVLVPHLTGYDSTAYDALIDEAFNATDKTSRAALLHQAEELLMTDMPVIPLFVYKNAYIKSSDIKSLSFDWYGNTVFTKMYDKTFVYVKGEEVE